MKKFGIVSSILIGSVLATSVHAANVDISGHYMGGFNTIRQDDRADGADKRSQFDYAANVDFNLTLADGITGIVQIQASPGQGNMGFVDGLEITDLAIEMELDAVSNEQYSGTLTMGSFDTPFGQQTSYLSNNANTMENMLILNPLLYSAFTGPNGTLNTLGLMYSGSSDMMDYTLSVSNGTDESAGNPDGNLSYVLRVTRAFKNINFGASYMSASDFKATNANGFQADFEGVMIDADWELSPEYTIRTYLAQVSYDDNNDATEDDVNSVMVEMERQFDGWSMALRYSNWNPKDADGSGNGQSAALPNPGYGNNQNGAVATDQKIQRLELGVSLPINDNMVFKAEYFMDQYDKETAGNSTDVSGILAYTNLEF